MINYEMILLCLTYHAISIYVYGTDFFGATLESKCEENDTTSTTL